MFSRNHIFLLGFLIWCSSCQSNQEEPVPTDRPVTFTPAIAREEARTRASNDSWGKDDRVGIYMIPHVASGSADLSTATAEATNIEYKTTSSGTSSDLVATNNYIRYPLDNSEVNFIAYYPFKSNVHSDHNHIYPINVGTQDPLTNIDLLYHDGTGTAYKRTPFETVSLVFKHQLSKLNITITSAADVATDLTSAEVILTGFPMESTFNLSTGSLGASSNPSTEDAPIVPVKDQDRSTNTELRCEAILIPNNGTDYTRAITLKIGEDSYSYTLPDNLNIIPGTAYQYDFTFTGSRIILAQNTIVDWEGGTVAWGNNLLTSSKIYFDLVSTSTAGNTVMLSTNASSAPTVTLSNNAKNNTSDRPLWITPVLSDGTPGSDGWTNYTLTFGTGHNIDAIDRTGYIRLTVEDLTLAIRVTQSAGAGLYVNDPSPASFSDLAYSGISEQTFTIQTNSQDEEITVATDNATLINNLTKSRGTVAGDGSSTWTIGFGITANSGTSERTGNITVTIGSITKTVSVSQNGLPPISVNEANSFLVKPGSNGIQFNATRPVTYGKAPTTALFTAVVLWDDNSVLSGTPTVSDTGTNTVVTVVPNSNSGNAVVALQISGVTYWSYHIWVTNYTGSTTWSNNGFTFMDRNLGATEAALSLTGRGLLYQWGRKDPFPGVKAGTAGYAALSEFKGMTNAGSTATVTVSSSTNAGAILESVKNPTTFYVQKNEIYYDWLPVRDDTMWGHGIGTAKSVYDPCPEGWRVPSYKVAAGNFPSDETSPWHDMAGQSWTHGADTGGTNWGGNALYPAAGHLDGRNGQPVNAGVYAYYWSASPYNSAHHNAAFMYFNYNMGINTRYYSNRSYGFSVRCVKI